MYKQNEPNARNWVIMKVRPDRHKIEKNKTIRIIKTITSLKC